MSAIVVLVAVIARLRDMLFEVARIVRAWNFARGLLLFVIILARQIGSAPKSVGLSRFCAATARKELTTTTSPSSSSLTTTGLGRRGFGAAEALVRAGFPIKPPAMAFQNCDSPAMAASRYDSVSLSCHETSLDWVDMTRRRGGGG